MFLEYLFFVSAGVAAVMALVTAWLARRSPAHWALVAGISILAVENLCNGLSLRAPTIHEFLRWHFWSLQALAWLPGTWIFFSLVYARGNSGDFLRKWRMPLIAIFVLTPALAVSFRHELIVAHVPRDPADRWVVTLGWPGLALHFFLLVGAVAVLTNLERTFRASVGTMRWRIKFMLLGVAVLFTVRLYSSSQILLSRDFDPSLESTGSVALLVAIALMLRSAFRTGSFHRDVYPSQSVLEGSLTVLLAGIYLVIIGILSKVVGYFGGGSGFALKSLLGLVSLVLLTLLLQSDRFRLHVRRFVSRHFQRPLYDYRTMWRKFNESTASRVEQTDLCRSMVRMIAEMFQALSVTIWLRDEQKQTLVLAASTSLSELNHQGPGPQPEESGAVIEHFQTHPEPTDIEGSRSPWAVALREWHPGEFPNGGHRVCIPLIGRGEMIGLITLGDRVSGTAYSVQDFDMLKCVGDHAAASLLNVQLSQKFLQAKEMEAFQTMAAFFVHDLKNAASTLNLMLQNLPVHFDDPAFRADTLRGMSKTVTHINQLIGRLGLLRHELNLRPAMTDLNEVVTVALAGFGTGLENNLTREFQPLPKVLIDQEQMLKVITNLVLNATEAVGGEGAVRVSTRQDRNSVILTIKDNGCGMSADFLQRSLFRPFQTTKKGGLGIGMFQSKMIVEAHQGRITVASEVGQGTIFEVVLPVSTS